MRPLRETSGSSPKLSAGPPVGLTSARTVVPVRRSRTRIPGLASDGPPGMMLSEAAKNATMRPCAETLASKLSPSACSPCGPRLIRSVVPAASVGDAQASNNAAPTSKVFRLTPTTRSSLKPSPRR